jgi:molybdate transport system ATP-binding protein
MNHYPRQLSGGQKQRTAMARLIAQKPDIILLDEPFSALDSYLKWELEREMKEILKEENKITLFVSHNRDEVYRFSHEVGCIDRGKMEEALPVKEFFENPGTRTAAMLSGCKNISGAEPVDEHHILAKDWNCILTVERKIPESTRAVGIRAHSFSEKETGDNCFAITESRVQEEPFEWSVDFKPENCDRFLQWKFPKQGQIPAVPEKIYVHSRDILLLRE